MKSIKEKSVLLIHLPTRLENSLSLQELEYFSAMNSVGKLMGDLPFEAPIGLLYIASYLRKNGIKVDFIDFNMQDELLRNKKEILTPDRIKEEISLKKSDIIGITSMTSQESYLIEVARIAKNENPNAIIVAGGTHPSFYAEELLSRCHDIDLVVVGEGEKALLEISLNVPIEKIKGVYYKKDREIIKNPKQKLLSGQELDNLPFPSYDLLLKESYPIIPRILAARGCLGKCNFCIPNKLFGNKIRHRSPESIVDEIQWLIDNFDIMKSENEGLPYVLIGDLTFGATTCSMELVDLIIKKNISINWWCQTRVDIIEQEKINLKKMYEAGCRQIAIGVEAFSASVLDRTFKNITQSQAVKSCRKLKELGFLVQGYFMIGLPNETIFSVCQTINMIEYMLKNELIDLTHISLALPYPGTAMFKNPEKYNYTFINKNFSLYNMGTGVNDGGPPPYESKYLTSHQIYTLWQLALSTAAKQYQEKNVYLYSNVS